MTYTPLRSEDVDAAAGVGPHRESGGPEAGDGRVGDVLKGGVLYVRVRGVDSLAGKPWVYGGWRQTVKVRAWAV